MHPEGPATGHLDTGFLGFLCLQANAEMVPNFQVATSCFSCSPPDFKLIKITSSFSLYSYQKDEQA
jgi:hypothetical protein